MPRIRQIIGFMYLTVCLATLFSCASLRPRPMAFEEAIQSVTNKLMMRVLLDRGLFFSRETVIVIDPFVNADTGEVIRASREIEKIIIREGQEKFKRFNFIRMTSENLRKANYAMNGAVRYVPPGTSPSMTEGNYNVSASVVNLKTGKIIGRSDVQIYDRGLDYTSTLFYKDSPMYIKDPPSEGSIKTAMSPVGSEANRAYYDSLETLAMLVEAEEAYGKSYYNRSLKLLKKVLKRPDGQLMKTHAGLYNTYRRLGRMDLAEEAFAKLLSLSIEKNKILTVKFLFDVNSVNFWRDRELKKQYGIWLRQIGKYFSKSSYCLRIVGHCSRTGEERYNDTLSTERAHRIQELLKSEFPGMPGRSEAVGKGFRENVIGSGTDDERDAIDRRVEFVVTECK
ncbi:OmpA family protein [Desulfococcaceae bacterium HSG8]|nr:OmpA family protein [Desulfococcaceae bacterium HSG8]